MLFFFYFISNRLQRQINATYLCFISSLTYIYRYGWLLLSIGNIVYILFLPFLYPTFISPDSRSPTLFLAPLGKSDSGVRDDTLFLYSRSASLRGTGRDPQIPERRITIGDLAAIHGGPLTSRGGDLRVSMKIPAVAPWRREGGKRKVETTGQGRPKRRRRSNWFPPFGSLSVNSHDVWETGILFSSPDFFRRRTVVTWIHSRFRENARPTRKLCAVVQLGWQAVVSLPRGL